MKKSVISLLLTAVLLVGLLTGCIHQDMGVKMNRDGTGSITTTLGIEKSFYEQMKAMDSDPFEGKSVTEYQYEGKTYVAYAETKECASYEEMEQALLDMTYETEMLEDAQDPETEDTAEDVVVVIDDDAQPQVPAPATDDRIFSSVNIEKNSGIFYSSYTFNAVLNPQSSDGLDFDLNEAFKVTLSVEMPGEISSTKGGKVDGNQVVFDIADITERQELTATCEENNTVVVVGIAIGLILLAVCAFCLIKFKK